MFDHQDRGTWLSADRPDTLRPIIAPSILASDFARLLDECKDVLSVEGGASEWLHVDVMDGHFVPNISIGMCVVEALRKHLQHTFLDVHCMVSHPDRWVDEMAKAGASQMTFHVEAAECPKAVARHIRAAGMQCGVALKPKTPASAVTELIEEKLVDMVLVMTVEPGFGGQSFMHDMMPKVAELRRAYPHLNIQVDGGLGEKTIDAAAEAGANIIVAGTSIFKAAVRRQVTETMRNAVKKSLTPK
ncbi:putative ribulose-5-phosphate 3-epimerase [Trypanosoma cruzi]|uniref:Ribulose-phosphate 3-epimerase n=2 Tax=Trypanosoma cruzi TaxID=5693 RepID=Q4DGY1_TRYCC|nr:ribulose-5-phosphate 3-epimerase, putative [Trypanosoma cruzi]ABW88687.1 ribulose-phosphate 3-epimerase [Trypanosoma cruzi]EAN91779.1 ribulose-5-phosphate 3-epimerase, putative [Trypanosoma cruzi]PWV20043.1 putative ribulose-5-phosphate 3-epimerase [Trypanosoma cruzi]RNC46774.1 ribulose-5-phosphate 3-epimerase [Trypanosoma cruzi]|eukprot:XP_813630.1 ribulose-5-phosphate 3-epimerase [Trypanosoma cruzi strain CL Brener]